jgi:ThiF family
MRNATIVVVNLKGLATEVIKNVVLAGIGKLVVVDAADVSEEDLGAGFFFAESDVGSNVSCGSSCFSIFYFCLLGSIVFEWGKTDWFSLGPQTKTKKN